MHAPFAPCELSDAELLALLHDDVPSGDLTTRALGIGGQAAELGFFARQAMTLCAIEEAARLFELAGARAQAHAVSGASLAAGAPMLSVQGPAASLHRAWKTAQNLVEWASGLASATAAIVAAASGVPVACTRKHVPGTKALSVKAVLAGGGVMHRLGLSETLLVFAEHRLFLDEPPAQTVRRLRSRQAEKKIVVEVADVGAALRWADAGADVLQLEKFTPQTLAECRQAVEASALARSVPRALLAAAGGLRADNAGAYVAAGADLLVTSAPYWAPPKDVQVTFLRAPT
jgi:molybdenum transport protein